MSPCFRGRLIQALISQGGAGGWGWGQGSLAQGHTALPGPSESNERMRGLSFQLLGEDAPTAVIAFI